MTLASEPLPETVNLEFALHFSSIVFHDTSIFYILIFDEINSSSFGVNNYIMYYIIIMFHNFQFVDLFR